MGPGEFQITTDTGMVRSLILKHRDEGRFRERTMYYRRRVTILFDNPVIVEKGTPPPRGRRLGGGGSAEDRPIEISMCLRVM